MHNLELTFNYPVCVTPVAASQLRDDASFDGQLHLIKVYSSSARLNLPRIVGFNIILSEISPSSVGFRQRRNKNQANC